MKIVRTHRFTKDFKRMGATEADVEALERTLAANPMVGDVIPGLGGVRKVPFGYGGRGKRGGGRAIYPVLRLDATPSPCCGPTASRNGPT